MRNATADFVGLSNLPLFGPQGKHHGCEDYLVIDFVPTRSPPRVMTLRIVSRLDFHAF